MEQAEEPQESQDIARWSRDIKDAVEQYTYYMDDVDVTTLGQEGDQYYFVITQEEGPIIRVTIEDVTNK